MKNRKKILIFLALAAFSLFPALMRAEEYSEYGNPLTPVTIGKVKIEAEVVSTPDKLYRGLGFRKALLEGQGMLFVMPNYTVQVFCMRGMRFPLDIIWLRPGKVAGLAKNIPPEYRGEMVSPAPVDYVLEVPAGFCDKHGIKVGDPADW